MAMKVSAAQFKAKMGRYMRAVRQGQEIVITDRDEPVARLAPLASNSNAQSPSPLDRAADPAAPPLGEVVVASIRYRGRSTSTILRADRDKR